MQRGTGQTHINAEDVALLDAFAAIQGLTSADLVTLAMTALAAQIRAQVPHCARCPLVLAHSTEKAENIIIGPW